MIIHPPGAASKRRREPTPVALKTAPGAPGPVHALPVAGAGAEAHLARRLREMELAVSTLSVALSERSTTVLEAMNALHRDLSRRMAAERAVGQAERCGMMTGLRELCESSKK